jgi:hypothetical protein
MTETHDYALSQGFDELKKALEGTTALERQKEV